MMIKNIIFDLDGVVRGIKNTPLNEIIPKQYHTEYKGVGLCDFLAKYLPMNIFKEWDKGKVSALEVLNEILKVSDEPEDVVKLAFNALLLPEHNFVYNPTIRLIKALKKEKYKLFILSNMCIEVVNILPKLFDLSLFDKTCFSCNVGLRKPDKQFYEKALQQFDIDPCESLFIDDNYNNLVPFQNFGGHTFLFDYKNIDESIKNLENTLNKKYKHKSQ